MFLARRLCLFFLVVFFSLQASEGFCQSKYSISKEMYDRCVEVVVAYVKKSRNWDEETYRIHSAIRYELFNAVSLSVTSKAYIEELKKSKGAREGFRCELNPEQEFIVIVDIVDYVVLSEGDINTYFPNAKPGYERAVPPKF